MKIENLKNIMIWIFCLLICVGIFLLIFSSAKKVIIECDKYDQVKFRYVGRGGLFGGVEKMEVHGDFYDGTMKKCMSGTNILGGKI